MIVKKKLFAYQLVDEAVVALMCRNHMWLPWHVQIAAPMLHSTKLQRISSFFFFFSRGLSFIEIEQVFFKLPFHNRAYGFFFLSGKFTLSNALFYAFCSFFSRFSFSCYLVIIFSLSSNVFPPLPFQVVSPPLSFSDHFLL